MSTLRTYLLLGGSVGRALLFASGQQGNAAGALMVVSAATVAGTARGKGATSGATTSDAGSALPGAAAARSTASGATAAGAGQALAGDAAGRAATSGPTCTSAGSGGPGTASGRASTGGATVPARVDVIGGSASSDSTAAGQQIVVNTSARPGAPRGAARAAGATAAGAVTVLAGQPQGLKQGPDGGRPGGSFRRMTAGFPIRLPGDVTVDGAVLAARGFMLTAGEPTGRASTTGAHLVPRAARTDGGDARAAATLLVDPIPGSAQYWAAAKWTPEHREKLRLADEALIEALI